MIIIILLLLLLLFRPSNDPQKDPCDPHLVETMGLGTTDLKGLHIEPVIGKATLTLSTSTAFSE